MRNIGRKSDQKLRIIQFEDLVRIFSCTESRDEVKAVLQTLLMLSERDNISQRATLLSMFLDGNKFEEVRHISGASPSTVARAFDQYLKNGNSNKLFKIVVDRANELKKKEAKKEPISYSKEYGRGIGIRAELRENKRSQDHVDSVKRQRERDKF